MKKRENISNRKIVLMGLAGLLVFGGLMVVMLSPVNDSDLSRWFKTNFFPADEYASTSILDIEQSEITSQEYRGSTLAAWILCGMLSIVALVVATLYFAKERGFIYRKGESK